jgi:hypothetical protein
MKTTKSVSEIADAAHATATGVDTPMQTEKKGRARKNGVKNPTLAVKKKKEPKAPRNPFRRSDTGKLQLKRLQMGKRVETMTPRVELLRERLSVMQSRLDYISGKLTLVVEELGTRASTGEEAAVVIAVDLDASATASADEDIALDDADE